MSISPWQGTPRRALLLIVLGVTLAVAAFAVVSRSRPADDFGAVPVAVPASVAPSASSAASPAVPVRDGALPAASRDEGPTRLRIPALDLDAAVDAVGIDARTGDFAVPASVDRVGWYRFGPGFAARAGSIVVAGHVDSAAEGEGAFFRLGALEAGDRVTLSGPGGETRSFEVVARERYRKTAIPLERYFARDGEVRLTLITCGGPFDEKTRHYRDNVVVTATAWQPPQ
ncbi:class F sortase [Actinoplanes sp. NPDC023714]|uniref:class F sortase n=1 Tax=Actinoplanes sp. NPDC023714 TaxID=3154322 RepID=UPI0033D13D99